MSIKSSQMLVAEALKEIKTIGTGEAYQLAKDDKCNLIDMELKTIFAIWVSSFHNLHFGISVLNLATVKNTEF